jgi:predicted Na+-dependent transporter
MALWESTRIMGYRRFAKGGKSMSLLIKLCLTVALPIIVGLFLKARYEGLADRLGQYVHKISSVFMLLMAALLILLNYKDMFRLIGSGAPLAAVILLSFPSSPATPLGDRIVVRGWPWHSCTPGATPA